MRGMRTLAPLGAALAAAALASGPAAAAPADLDAGFGSDGRATIDLGSVDGGRAVAIDPAGRIAIGAESGAGAARQVAVARLTPAGAPDAEFSGGHVLRDPSPGAPDYLDDLLVGDQGRLLVGGTFDGHAGILRLRGDGLADTAFAGDGMVKHDFGHTQRGGGIVRLPEGALLWYGRGDYPGPARDLDIARFTAGGALDATFGAGGLARVSLVAGTALEQYKAAVRLTDGRLLVGGDGGTDWRIARLQPGGTLDTSFGANGQLWAHMGGNDYLYDMAVAPDGRIVAVGGADGDSDLVVAAWLPDGTPDASFGAAGRVFVDLGGNEVGRAVALAPDGKIVVAGATDASGVGDDVLVVRLNPDGSRDGGFGIDGARSYDVAGSGDRAYDVALQPDGRIVVVGHAWVDGTQDVLALRLQGDPPPAPPPGGDGGAERQPRGLAVRILGKRLAISRRGVARLRLRCSTDRGPCRGRIAIRTARKLRVGARRKPRRVAIAAKRVRLPAGRARVVRMRVARAKLRLLRARPAARQVVVAVTLRDGAGARKTVRKRLRAPRPASGPRRR